MPDDDAAIDQCCRRFLRIARQARHQGGDLGVDVDAGDEQLAGKAMDQQAHAFLKAFAAAGGHDDGIGMALRLLDVFRQFGDEQEQAEHPEQRQKRDEAQQPPHAAVSRSASTAAPRFSCTATGRTWPGNPAPWASPPLPLRTRIRRQPAAAAASRSLSASPIITVSSGATRKRAMASNSMPGAGLRLGPARPGASGQWKMASSLAPARASSPFSL